MKATITEQKSVSNQTKRSNQYRKSKSQSVVNSMLIQIVPTNLSNEQQQEYQNLKIDL